jgi:kynurenine formamidase
MNDWAGRFYETSSSFPAAGNIRAYDLAVALEAGMSRHPAHPPFSFVLTKRHGEFAYPGGISAISESFSMGAHVGTHIDALGHLAYCGEVHGGHPIDAAHTPTGGLEIASAEEIPPLLGPGHLVDGEALFGRELTPADGIGASELSSWFSEHPAPGPGSVVLIRTGWMRLWSKPNTYIGLDTGLPGLTRDGAEWLSERGVVAVGGDTMNLEHKIAGVVSLQVHLHFLFETGIYIMESLNLEVLAADGVRDFTFFASPLRLRGATGSPLRPLAVINT